MMKTKLRLVLSIPLLFLFFTIRAQEEGIYWENQPLRPTELTLSRQPVKMGSARSLRLREAVLRAQLQPLHSGSRREVEVRFPDVSGNFRTYRVRERSVMSAGLQANFPGIRSYVGLSAEGGASRIRFSLSHKGLQGMIVDPATSVTRYLEPSAEGTDTYLFFSREDVEPSLDGWKCKTDARTGKSLPPVTGSLLIDDQQLRTYRLAVATTGEYTQYHGGTVSDALAAINATLTRVNEVFERDLAIRLTLIAQTTGVIYTDPDTDPFGGNLSSEVQSVLDREIGPAAYDIGHLFHQAGENGNAGFIGSVCVDGRKGSAFASTPTPEGDRFDLDFVAHEMGHQFGANHTWSFQTESTGVQAEPGSGSTIMGYAGITQENDVQSAGDDYFHFYSILQIGHYVAGTSCAVETPLENSPPRINSLQDYVIPRGTAFVLEGNATDPDEGDLLTFCWEQIDDGVVPRSAFGPDNPAGANFRSRRPVAGPDRYMPLLSRVASGNLTQTDPATGSAWETVAAVERDLNFALTVRDNAEGGGQLSADRLKVRVEEQAGPFEVISQAQPESYEAGSVQTILWDPAGTDKAPINTQLVDVYLSTDGGLTFPSLIAEDLPNTGTARVQLPRAPTPFGRFMVRASDNIFFAVNASDFNVEERPFLLYFDALNAEVCQSETATLDFTYQTFGGFEQPVALAIEGVPPGLSASLSASTVQVDGSRIRITFSSADAVPPGTYQMEVTGTDGTDTARVPVSLRVAPDGIQAPVLVFPEDASTDVNLIPELRWSGNAGDIAYDLELATDAGFTDLIQARRIYNNRYTPGPLEDESTYYWRVRAVNACGVGAFGVPFRFSTISSECKTVEASGLPITISAVGTPVVTSVIAVADDRPVLGVKVKLNIEHSFLSDLVVSLTSPRGTRVTLVSNSCGEANDINATFAQDAPPFVCGSNPAISGTVRPLGSLDAFVGEPSFGEWTLTVEDTAPVDGGRIVEFALELCVEGAFRPDADRDGVFDDGDDLCLGTPPGAEVNADGCEVFRFPEDRFLVTVSGESCIGQGDGSILVEANESFDYTIRVTGSGADIQDVFSNTYEVVGLAPGEYEVCLGGSDGGNQYETQCYQVNVRGPDPLNVTARQSPDFSSLELGLEGSDLYMVTLNGQTRTVEGPFYTLELEKGFNQLKVEGFPACKGSFEASYLRSDIPLLAPNPFRDMLEIRVADSGRPLGINVFGIAGTLVWSGERRPVSGKVVLQLAGLPSGWYLIQVRQADQEYIYKVRKE